MVFDGFDTEAILASKRKFFNGLLENAQKLKQTWKEILEGAQEGGGFEKNFPRPPASPGGGGDFGKKSNPPCPTTEGGGL